jgi:hypothetical protein
MCSDAPNYVLECATSCARHVLHFDHGRTVRCRVSRRPGARTRPCCARGARCAQSVRVRAHTHTNKCTHNRTFYKMFNGPRSALMRSSNRTSTTLTKHARAPSRTRNTDASPPVADEGWTCKRQFQKMFTSEHDSKRRDKGLVSNEVRDDHFS